MIQELDFLQICKCSRALVTFTPSNRVFLEYIYFMSQLKHMLPQEGTNCISVGESLFGRPHYEHNAPERGCPGCLVFWERDGKIGLNRARGKSSSSVAPPATLVVDFYIIRGLHSNFNVVHHYLETAKLALLFLTEMQISSLADASYLTYPVDLNTFLLCVLPLKTGILLAE